LVVGLGYKAVFKGAGGKKAVKIELNQQEFLIFC
jgi:hypothetical protein